MTLGGEHFNSLTNLKSSGKTLTGFSSCIFILTFPDVWLTGWLVPGRDRPLPVWAPPGTRNMMEHLTKAYEFDIGYRISDDKAKPQGAAINTKEIKPRLAYAKDGLKITAIEVDHAPIKPACGYRIDFNGHSVVLSGDTRPNANLERHAQNADLFIHEVVIPASLERAGSKPERMKSVIGHHTTPEQAGKFSVEQSRS